MKELIRKFSDSLCTGKYTSPYLIMAPSLKRILNSKSKSDNNITKRICDYSGRNTEEVYDEIVAEIPKWALEIDLPKIERLRIQFDHDFTRKEVEDILGKRMSECPHNTDGYGDGNISANRLPEIVICLTHPGDPHYAGKSWELIIPLGQLPEVLKIFNDNELSVYYIPYRYYSAYCISKN